MVRSAGRARMRTPAGVGTHSPRRADHWNPGDHMRGGSPSPRGMPRSSQRRATVRPPTPSRRVA
eukprot:1410011-Alexandrium_andersonii.AAC.1